jgi:deoxycytidylate deaminase
MRPSFDDVAIRIAKIIAERSTCLRLHTAAVICTQDNRISDHRL